MKFLALDVDFNRVSFDIGSSSPSYEDMNINFGCPF